VSLESSFWPYALEKLVAAFTEAEAPLCAYDAAVGDGDHGTSMLRGFTETRERVSKEPSPDCRAVWTAAGTAFLETVGGVTGIVFGSLFEAMGSNAPGPEGADAAALHRMFEAGLVAVKVRGKVSEGDKSMADALSPAVSALRAAAEAHQAPGEALQRAARAAENGMAATADMEARVGRARYQAARGKGHVDAGAASVSLLFQTLDRAAGEPGRL
jgi:phosphoenolpyruvate---glycerone phosphotransferase subunit DhaL